MSGFSAFISCWKLALNFFLVLRNLGSFISSLSLGSSLKSQWYFVCFYILIWLRRRYLSNTENLEVLEKHSVTRHTTQICIYIFTVPIRLALNWGYNVKIFYFRRFLKPHDAMIIEQIDTLSDISLLLLLIDQIKLTWR